MKKGLTVLSLFDGIGVGFEALKRAGITVDKYYASEIDGTAANIALKNHPSIIQIGDVRNWQKWDIGPPDLIIGGFPCIDLSIAGKQTGLISESLMEYNNLKSEGYEFSGQSFLFWEFLNILNYYQPTYFFVENVKMKKEFSDIISNHLKCHPTLIDSADFSAQTRKRLYWTNIHFSHEWEKSPLTVEDIMLEEVDDKYFIEPSRAVTILDNEVTARKIGFIGTDSQGNRIYRIHGKSVTLCGNSGGLGAKTGLYAMPCLTPGRLAKRQNGRRFKPPKSKFFTLTATDVHGILTDHYIRKLHPVEACRLQTLQDDYCEIEGISDNKKYKALGNSWTCEVIAHIFKGLNKEAI